MLVPSLSFASDGLLEINQACVSTGGCAGDEPGYPVTITGQAGRSYLLTSDLSLTDPTAYAIYVINAAQFVWKFRLARLSSEPAGFSPMVGGDTGISGAVR